MGERVGVEINLKKRKKNKKKKESFHLEPVGWLVFRDRKNLINIFPLFGLHVWGMVFGPQMVRDICRKSTLVCSLELASPGCHVGIHERNHVW